LTKRYLRRVRKFPEPLSKKILNRLKKDDIIIMYEEGNSKITTLGLVLKPKVKSPRNLPGRWIYYKSLTGKYEGETAFIEVSNIVKIVTRKYPEYQI